MTPLRTLLAVLLFAFAVLDQAAGGMPWEGPDLPPGPIEKVRFWKILEQRWRTIEPQLFTEEGAKKYLGIWVRFEGAPLSLKPSIVVKLASGTVARLKSVQKADLDELATFRKPPSTVTVEGPIVGIDLETRTIMIKAVSTSFWQ